MNDRRRMLNKTCRMMGQIHYEVYNNYRHIRNIHRKLINEVSAELGKPLARPFYFIERKSGV